MTAKEQIDGARKIIEAKRNLCESTETEFELYEALNFVLRILERCNKEFIEKVIKEEFSKEEYEGDSGSDGVLNVLDHRYWIKKFNIIPHSLLQALTEEER